MNYLGQMIKCSAAASGTQFNSVEKKKKQKNFWFNFLNTDLLYIKHGITLLWLSNSILVLKLTLRASKLAEGKICLLKSCPLLLDLKHVRLILILLFPTKLYF